MANPLRQVQLSSYPDRPPMKTRQPSKPRVIALTADDRMRAERREGLLSANLAYLMALEAAGLGTEAAELVDHIASGLARRPVKVVDAPTAAVLPKAERGRHDYDLKRLDRINLKLAVPMPRGDKGAEERRKELLREREALEGAPAAQAERVWLDRGAAETLTLAGLRGEESERLPSGALRVNNRDAFYGLVRKLSPEQYDAGAECRDCYEVRSQGLGSQMGALGQVGCAGNDNSHSVFAGVQRAKKLQRLGNIERGILVGVFRMTDGTLRQIAAHAGFAKPGAPTPHVALQMLRGVCGQNVALSSYGEGRAFDRNLAALKLALDVADAVICGR